MKNVTRELSLLALIAIPYVYLASIWNSLPETVPTHFNLAGEPDDWHHKTFLIYMPGVIMLGVYLLFLLLPKIDPKRKIEQMGDKKYFSFRFIVLLFLAMLNMYMLNQTQVGKLESPNMLLGLIGGLFAALGNYFQALRPNYFMGIRTPWTLESESVWKKTHRLGGRLWMGGGIFIVLTSFIITDNLTFAILFGVVLAILVIVPVVFSYTEFRKEKKMVNTS